MKRDTAILKIESFTEGFLVLSVQDEGVKALVKAVTDKCREKYGGYMRVSMSPPYKPRTLEQNDKWWAMCTEYGRFRGMSKDDVALGVKYRAMDEGLWEYDEVPFSKTKERIPKSTTEADTAQMSVLIDVLYRIAAEDGYTFEDV